MASGTDSGVSSISSTNSRSMVSDVAVDASPESYSTTVQGQQETAQDATVSSSHSSPGETEHSSCSRESKEESYDFTLWYDKVDEQVAYELIDFLEDKHKLQGFIEDRDFIIGADKFRNIDRGVDNSEKILIVISRKSIQSAWFEKLIHHSLIRALESHKRKFCVIPIYVDLEKKEAPSALKTVAGVKYTAKHFWKRLENTMGISTEEVSISPSGSSYSSSGISPDSSSSYSMGSPFQASNKNTSKTQHKNNKQIDLK